MRTKRSQDWTGLTALLAIIWIVASWLTHIIWCISAGKWGFMIAGALFFPIAWIHGTMIWFGV